MSEQFENQIEKNYAERHDNKTRYKYLAFNKHKNVCYRIFKRTMSDLFLFHSHRQIFIEIFHLQIMKC
jgi:hypothetical protein